MRQAKVARLLDATGLRRLAGGVPWAGVLVLNYHRVGHPAGSPFDHGLWSATPDGFDAQVRFLKRAADVIAPADLPAVLARRAGRHVLVTFDDGYRDNHAAAFPVLKAHGLPATFFLATGFLDRPRLPWWDEIAWMVRTSRRDRAAVPPWLPAPVPFDEPVRERAVRTLLRAYKAMPAADTPGYLDTVAAATGTGRFDPAAARDLWMTWDMVRELHAAGMSVGGHTVTHPVLARLPADRQRFEVDECGRRLAAELGEPMRWFSYPVGGTDAFDADTRAALQGAGVRYGFSYYGGLNRFGDWDDYDVRRVPVETHTTPAWFRSIVSLPRVFAGW